MSRFTRNSLPNTTAANDDKAEASRPKNFESAQRTNKDKKRKREVEEPVLCEKKACAGKCGLWHACRARSAHAKGRLWPVADFMDASSSLSCRCAWIVPAAALAWLYWAEHHTHTPP